MVGGVHIPALKGRQGDRDMYLLSVKNTMLLRNFSAGAEPADTKDKKAQRSLDPRHAGDIVTYMVENTDDYVLGAVTYAIDVVDARDHFVELQEGTGVGFLVLPLDAELRCLDGQHRRQAIKEASEADPRLLDDYTAVVLYVEDDYMRRRQMFSDMNATPKVVAKALNVAFDSRDPYALAALRLADEHPMLKGVVEKEKARITTRSGAIFSLAGVYDALKRYVLGANVPRGRSPRDRDVDTLVQLGGELFDTLASSRDEFAAVTAQVRSFMMDDGSPTALGAYMAAERRATLLLSTTTLRVIAGALREALSRDNESDPLRYVYSLSQVDFTPDSPLFNAAGFVGRTGTPSARNQEVMAATRALAAVLAR
ncbi:DNA sulfur modification protein DndB [Nocardioides sp. CPCC 205120]|uniref:DNA sulfur modification protein DndB n=1 Tax=Nocardioides sp. CPCC 205120 TaxID=3406462 RepID=UPI003B51298F